MSSSRPLAPRRRNRDRALSYLVENRYARDASGRSVAFPDWSTAPARQNEIAVVLHVGTAADLGPYLTMLDRQETPFDLYVVSDAQMDSVGPKDRHGVREYLVGDPIADGLYQLVSLVNSGRLSGYRTVIRHVHRSSDSVGEFERFVASSPLASIDFYLHRRLDLGGIAMRSPNSAIPEFMGRRMGQLALRVNMRLALESDGREERCLRTFALRGSLVEALATLRVDHQDFYVTYRNYVDEGLASERPGETVPDETFGRALEAIYFRLLDRSLAVVEFAEALPIGWQPDFESLPIYEKRATVWAVYHPDLTTRTSTRNASWAHLVGSMPMHFGQEMPLSPIGLNFSDPLSAADRAAQTQLATAHGISAFLVSTGWDADGIDAGAFVESLEPDEVFPWAVLVAHPLTARTDPAADHPRFSAWQDPGLSAYPALADQIVGAFPRGQYLRLDGRPVVLLQDIEALSEPGALVGLIRAAAAVAGEDPWIGVVESYLTTSPPGDGLIPEFLDGLVQLPPASVHHRRWARLTSRLNGYSGHAVDLTTRDTAVLALSSRQDVRVIPGAMVGFDNTPVLRSQGEVGYNWNLFDFRRALEEAVRSVAWRDESRRIVAVNSWNGWADLSQLEPSTQRRSSYLSTVKDILEYPTLENP